MFTRILVPTDFSEPSNAALDYAKTLALRFGGSLHLLHVVDDSAVSSICAAGGYVPDFPDVSSSVTRGEVESRLQGLLSETERERLRATSTVVYGPVSTTIVDMAGDMANDLIVMGTHGRTGVTHALLGSVAERVVRLASCPVLTVHARPSAVAVRASNWSAAFAPA